MQLSSKVFESIVNSLAEHIVVIDKTGEIRFVNNAWIKFGQDNNCLIENTWKRVNYISVCDEAAKNGDVFGAKAAQGIREIIEGIKDEFYFEYPCHSIAEKRWFMMRITKFKMESEPFFILSHQNITERKLAEEKVLNLSRIDGLTDVPNRRYFDEFLDQEWRRCTRLSLPISLAILDIDHFKLLNDYYGHQVGDDCLKKIGLILKRFSKRPSDLCARYGGEEFAVILGNTPIKKALKHIHLLHDEIDKLKFPNEKAPTHPTVTVSAGLAMMFPKIGNSHDQLIKMADELLYKAKKSGRNQIQHNC